MALCPVLLGSFLSGWTWWQLLLMVAWLLAFLSFNAVGLWFKSIRNRTQIARPVVLYAACAGAGALALVYKDPALLWWGLALLPLAAVALWEVARRNERSLLARATAICASSLMAPVAYSLGQHQQEWTYLWISTGFLCAYLLGTVPYVKTLVRKRGDRNWLLGSVIFHFSVLVVAIGFALQGAVTWLVPASWLVLLGRAVLMPAYSRRRGKRLRPAIIGSTETLLCLMVMFCLLSRFQT